ncbi:putative Embryogenesis-associated protein EMB8 [Blattamonas nauphoetae]|uniref:Embryogenesis-associated protein EMB8 n=1 Tax=Blattamonas nauphoetae TaxID=2049346 RepID=A0ABQ9WVI8_9EUKA|nr:putative Embryogenesis-associated protein EMB8 [Blattamonas nauphoetae]
MTQPTSTCQRSHNPSDFPEPVSNNLLLYRKLRLVIDSCVGVLQRDDFPDYETELGNEIITDLSRFCYQSFQTSARVSNEIDTLSPYLFRASAYSLFGHLIINAQLFKNHKKTDFISNTESKLPKFLNVVTGTPGIGKSACRFPFITLLMSHGVKDVTTKKEGEGTFVFSKRDPKSMGMVNIKSRTVHGPVDFDTPSYLYTYDVDYFPLSEEAQNEIRQQTEKMDTPYLTTKYRGVLNNLETSRTSFLGQVSVPSVEYFPYFVRLLMGTQKSFPLKKVRSIKKDMFLTQPSKIVRGSQVAKGSNSTDPGTQFIDEKGNTLSLKSTPKKRSIRREGELTEFDQIVEADTFFSEGSYVLLKDISAKRRRLNDLEPITTDTYVEAGSIIREGSKIEAGSTLNYKYSIQNSLKDTRWHVIDDHQLTDGSQLNTDEFHVLFSSPKGLRWRTLNDTPKAPSYIIIESTVPKYAPQEEAAFLNTIPTISVVEPEDDVAVQRGVELFSFIPRFVLNPTESSRALKSISKDPKTGIPKSAKDLFELDVSHKLIHFTCPQFDCNNWHTEFASDLAKRNIMHVFGVQAKASYVEFLQTMKNHPEHSQEKGAIFHTFVSDAITRGFFISQPKRAFGGAQILKASNDPTKDVGIKLPPTIGEAYVFLRGPSNMSSAELPDLKTISPEKLRPLPQNFECLFENCATLNGVTWRELPKNDAGSSAASQPTASTNPTDNTSPKNDDGSSAASQPSASTNPTDNTSPKNDDGSSAASQPTASTNPTDNTSPKTFIGPFKCFTFYLNPLGGNNSGFDSILLFFQVGTYMDGTEPRLQIHKLSVMFIQSTMAEDHGLSDSGPNLMYLWVCLFCTVYGLNPDQIYPHLFYVTPPMGEIKTNYGKGASTEFFMKAHNIWEMCYYPEDPKSEENVELVEPKRHLMVNNVNPLPANDNPNHFRCYYCGLILEELFVDHICNHVRPKKSEGPSGPGTAWTVASSNIGIGMFDHPKPKKGVPIPSYTTTFVFNLWSNTSGGVDDRSDARKRVFEIELTYQEIGIFPNIHKSPRTFDIMNVVMVPFDQAVTPYHDPAVLDQPKTPRNCEFTIRPTQPLPNFFSLVPPISKDSISNRPNDEPPPFELVLAISDNLGAKPETLGLDVSNPKSHLHATLQMVHLWINGYQITFSKTKSLTIHEKKITPRNDFVELARWNDLRIPICPMHVPVSCYGKLPVIINQTSRYTLSDLRTLILSPDQSDSSISAEDMFIDFIVQGEDLPPDTVPRLLRAKAAKTPLVPDDLALLYERIPHLKEPERNDYDLQLLLSVVNGTRNHISEIMGSCCEYLDFPLKIPDSSVLDTMKQSLDNGYSAARQRLKPFLDRLKRGNRNFEDFGENSFEFKCLEDDALLPRWHQGLLIPWIMKGTVTRAKKYSKKLLSSDALQPDDKWVLIAAMMVHAPISQSEQTYLNGVIKESFSDQFQEDLLSLVNHYSEQSLEEVVCQSNQTRTKLWNQTLFHLRMNEALIPDEAGFLCGLFLRQAQKPKDLDGLINKITNCPISWKDQETLIALVNGLPRLTFQLRKDMMPNPPSLTEEERSGLVSKIEQSTLSEAERNILVNTLNHVESLTFQQRENMDKLMEKIPFSKTEKDALKIQFYYTYLLCSDTTLVHRSILHQLTSTQKTIKELFEIFRGTTTTPLDEKRKDTLKAALNESRSSIAETHRLLFERLKAKRFSRKDYAVLLCCPNGGRSFYLPGRVQIITPGRKVFNFLRGKENSLYYWAHWKYGLSGQLNSYGSHKCNKNPYRPRRESFIGADGGEFSVDWFDTPETSSLQQNAPIVVLVHGVNGGSSETWLQKMALRLANKEGYRVCCIILRGCCGSRATTMRSYHGGYTEDLHILLDTLVSRYPQSSIAVIGYSLGGNLVAKYFGERNSKIRPYIEYAHLKDAKPIPSNVKCGASICCPYDFELVDKLLSHKDQLLVAKGYEKFLLRNKDIFSKHPNWSTFEQNLGKQEFREIDAMLTISFFQYPDVETFYRDSSCRYYLDGIQHPFLFISCENDPMSLFKAFPKKELTAAPDNVGTLLVKGGGHVGMFSFADTRKTFDEEILVQYLEHNILGKSN